MAPKAEDTAVRRQGFAGAARRDARNVGRGFEAGKVGGISNGQVVAGCAWESRTVFERLIIRDRNICKVVYKISLNCQKPYYFDLKCAYIIYCDGLECVIE